MVGKTLSAVTLHEPGAALTENYLKVELAQPRPGNRLVDLRIGGVVGGGVVGGGLREAAPLHLPAAFHGL